MRTIVVHNAEPGWYVEKIAEAVFRRAGLLINGHDHKEITEDIDRLNLAYHNRLIALAFPQDREQDAELSGIPLRDWFAGQALVARTGYFEPKECARQAYQQADAMIAEREKQ